MVLTDHEAIRGIVHHGMLNTTSTDRANRRLTNASVYLSAYPLEVHYMPGWLNYMPDALSRLCTMGDDVVRESTVEPVLDALWDEDLGIEIGGVFLILSEIYMDDTLQQQFWTAYKADRVYSKIIQDLRPATARKNEEVLDASKFGHTFRLKDGLLYSKDNEGMERLVVPFPLVQRFL